MSMKKPIKYVGKKQRSCRLNQTPHTGTTRKVPMFLIDHMIIQPILGNSHIWTSIITTDLKKKKYITLSNVD
jgi:hypothetical protein